MRALSEGDEFKNDGEDDGDAEHHGAHRIGLGVQPRAQQVPDLDGQRGLEAGEQEGDDEFVPREGHGQEEGGEEGGPHHGGGDEDQDLRLAGAEVTRGALDIGLVLAHLAVDDGEAERQVDHHVPDARGHKPPWTARKQAYLDHLRLAHDDVLLVSGSDKLHNARAIVEDLLNIGVKVFDRFSASKEQTLWYYDSLAIIFESRLTPLAKALRETVDTMKRLSA